MGRTEKWKDRLEASNHALVFLFFASMAESTVVPIPLESILIPFMLNNRDKLWRIATAVTLGCLVGATLGYGIGMLFYQSLGQWVVETFNQQEQFERLKDVFQENGFVAVLSLGISPIPFQIAMLAAGVTGYSIWLFLAATAIARGIRYYGLALLVRLFGKKTMELWEKNRFLAAIVILAVIGVLYLVGRALGG